MSLQVELLEQSFEEIKPEAEAFVDSFYDNLFTANPEAKPLFETTDMKSQKTKLLKSLVLVVDNLRMPDVLSGALKGLGARHVKYGALPEHYPLVGSALLTTFEQYLGEKWTPDTKQAWIDAYGAISSIMLEGAEYSPADIALAPPEPQTSSSPQLAVAGISPRMETRATVGVVHNPDKAAVTALAGGGIMGITATVLTLLL
ncbi:MAG: globin family protein [Cyanobacteria bacterium J06621_8]